MKRGGSISPSFVLLGPVLADALSPATLPPRRPSPRAGPNRGPGYFLISINLKTQARFRLRCRYGRASDGHDEPDPPTGDPQPKAEAAGGRTRYRGSPGPPRLDPQLHGEPPFRGGGPGLLPGRHGPICLQDFHLVGVPAYEAINLREIALPAFVEQLNLRTSDVHPGIQASSLGPHTDSSTHPQSVKPSRCHPCSGSHSGFLGSW